MSDFEDPVRFVFRTWPWREDVDGLPQALRPVIGQTGESWDKFKIYFFMLPPRQGGSYQPLYGLYFSNMTHLYIG